MSGGTGTTTPTTADSASPLSSPEKKARFYGSTSHQPSSVSFDFGDDDETVDPEQAPMISRSSSHYSISMIDTSNVWTSYQRNANRLQADLVPSIPAPSVRLVLDPNLESGESGRLYYDCGSLYNLENKTPQYALTVHPDIYQNVCQEVSDAQSTPCGLYFCCHGGDGAHTGVTGHKDSVDIRIAVAVMGVFLVALIAIEVVTSVDDEFDYNV